MQAKINPTCEQVARAAEPHVKQWLLAKAKAEIMRKYVDHIWNAVLAEIPVYTQDKGDRITDHKYAWLASDTDWKRIFAVADRLVREQIPGAAALPKDHCPALVAERQVVEIEHALVGAIEPYLGVDWHRLCCAGMDKLREYIDLTVKMVINRPGFQKPDIERELAAIA